MAAQIELDGRKIQLNFKVALPTVLLAVAFSAGCRQQSLKVLSMPMPDYPLAAESRDVEGAVTVTVGIGTDGKVQYAAGSGPSSLLVHAAEENAKGWVFEVPPRAAFPLEHQIQYTFKIDKSRGANLMPTVVTDLPNAVQIIGTRVVGDTVTLVPSKPSEESATPDTK